MAEAEKNEEVKAPSNFIHDFIDEDLAEIFKNSNTFSS